MASSVYKGVLSQCLIVHKNPSLRFLCW